VILAPLTKQQNWQKCIYSSIHFANTFSATPTHHDFSIPASCNLKLTKQKKYRKLQICHVSAANNK